MTLSACATDRGCLRANLEALAAAGIRPADASAGPDVRLEEERNGTSLFVSTPAGGWARLHSGRNPVGDADKLIAPVFDAPAPPPCVVVIGLGLGYVLDAIERRSAATRVLAFEPAPKAAASFLGRRDWTDWIASGRLRLFYGPDYHGASDAWQYLDPEAPSAPVIAHPVLLREWGEQVACARHAVERAVFGARANADARKRFAGPYLLNTLRNLDVITREGDAASLDGLFRGLPAIVAAAGPSLDENLVALGAVADRAILVSVDTALRPMVAAGMPPHFVVAVDPQEANARHLCGLPPCPGTWLVAEGSVHSSAFGAFAGRTFVFHVSDHHPWPWLTAQGAGRGRLRAWGSVLVTAFDLALAMGCDPIVFIGADAACTDGRPYARGTYYEDAWAETVARGATLPQIWSAVVTGRPSMSMDDLAGLPNSTTQTFLAFRDWIVEASTTVPDRRLVNATGRGFLQGGRIVQAGLGDALRDAAPLGERVPDVMASLLKERTRREPLAVVTGALAGDSPVVTEWIEATSRTVSWDDIQAALDEATPPVGRIGMPVGPQTTIVPVRACASLLATGAIGSRPALPSCRRLPERVAAVRAIVAGAEMPSWARPGSDPEIPSDANAAASLLTDATAAIGRVLSLPVPAMRLLPGYEHAAAGGSDTLSLTAAFDWSPEARPDIDLLERCARIASSMVSPTSDQAQGDPFRWVAHPSSQARVQPGMAPGERVPLAQDTIVWLARRAALVEWAGILRTLPDGSVDDASFGAHLAEWLRAVADGPHQVTCDQASAVLVVRMTGRDGATVPVSFDLSTPLWRVMRPLTGTIVPVPADGDAGPAGTGADGAVILDATVDPAASAPHRLSCSIEARPPLLPGTADPRCRFLAGRQGAVRPVVLAMPGSYSVGTLDGGSAIVTPYLADHSVAVDASGNATPLPAWPYPIVGELRGQGTGGVAWARGPAWYLMRRRSADGPVETVASPFRPGRAVLLEDGASCWSSTSGGLWRWAPSGDLSCLGVTPPALGLCRVEGGLRLDPVATDVAGRSAREVLGSAWIWRFDDGRLELLALGPEGPMCRLAERGGLRAAVHTAADLVRVGDRHGDRFDIACDWPVDAGWAGASLVVVTAHGSVLLFEDLEGRLFR